MTIMTRILSAFGFFAGMALLAIFFFYPPAVGQPVAREAATTACHNEEVAADEGYGISLKEVRLVCGPIAD